MDQIDFKVSRQNTISRKKDISNVKYNILFDFTKSKEYFNVETTIIFDYINISNTPVFLDQKNISIIQLKVNNQDISVEKAISGEKLILNNLKSSSNEIFIISEGYYSQDGNGISKHIDKNNVFIYSLFVPNFTRTAFPCFEQPDIKATFKISLICDEKWTAFSNEYVKEGFPVAIEDQLAKWEFEETKLLPTYLIAVAAGNFAVIEKGFEGTNIILIAKYSSGYMLLNELNNFAEIVHKCKSYYESLFQTLFPFDEIKFLFCPEFNFNGMEHPGLIYLSEGNLYWEKNTTKKYTTRTTTIVHEIAHMWFGNYVTMKWWDDIWLNESFAVLVSQLVLEYLELPEVENIPLNSLGYKQNGYERDLLDNSHPIRQIVNFPEEMNDLFDSITYSKGAAVLKQLYFIMGKENFSSAMKSYFKAFKWENADSNDFFKIFQLFLENEKIDLLQWKQDWIETPSFNILKYSLVNKPISGNYQIDIIQYPINENFKFFRDHYFEVYICSEEIDNFTILKVKVLKSQNENKIDIPSDFKFNPENYGILLNFGDYSYIKASFDSKSRIFFTRNFNKTQNILLKGTILYNLQECVYKKEMNANEYLQFLLEALSNEENLQIFHQILTISAALLEILHSSNSYFFCEKMFSYLYLQLVSFPHNKEKNLIILDNLHYFAKDEASKMKLTDWIMGRNQELMGIQFNSSILTHVIELIFLENLLPSAEKSMLILRYLTSNKYYQHFSRFSMLSFEEKLEEWDNFVNLAENSDSFYLTAFKMKGFNNLYDKKSQEYFEKKFFEDIGKVMELHPFNYSSSFFNSLFPKTENFKLHLEELRKLMNSGKLKENNACVSLLIKKIYILQMAESLN